VYLYTAHLNKQSQGAESQQNNISKSYEQILIKFFGDVKHCPGTNWLDYGGDSLTLSLVCFQFFTPIMHFPCHSNVFSTIRQMAAQMPSE